MHILVQLVDLRKELATLRSDLALRRKELKDFMDREEENLQDPYTQIMLPFFREAETHVGRQWDQLQQVERMYMDTIKFLGEGPSRPGAVAQTASEDFFGIFREFVIAYRKCKRENDKRDDERRMQQRLQDAKQERARELAEAQSRRDAGVDDEHVLEDLIRSLHQSSILSSRRRERGQQRGVSNGSASSPQNISGDTENVAAQMLAELNPDVPTGTHNFPRHRRRPRRPSARMPMGRTSRVSLPGEVEDLRSEAGSPLGRRDSVSSYSASDTCLTPTIDTTANPPERPHRHHERQLSLGSQPSRPPRARGSLSQIMLAGTTSSWSSPKGDQQVASSPLMADADLDPDVAFDINTEDHEEELDEGDKTIAPHVRTASAGSADLVPPQGKEGPSNPTEVAAAEPGFEWFDPDRSGFKA